jgi:hypothetical protein
VSESESESVALSQSQLSLLSTPLPLPSKQSSSAGGVEKRDFGVGINAVNQNLDHIKFMCGFFLSF